MKDWLSVRWYVESDALCEVLIHGVMSRARRCRIETMNTFAHVRRINVARSGPRASFPSARTAPAPSHYLPFSSFHGCRGAEASLFLVPFI